MTDPTAPSHAELLAAIEQLVATMPTNHEVTHAFVEDGPDGSCVIDGEHWPCYAARAADLLTRAAAKIRALEVERDLTRSRREEADRILQRLGPCEEELAALREAFAPVGVYFMDPPDGGSVTFGEQVARLVADWQALRQDRERLDWLDSQSLAIVRLASDKLIVSDEGSEPGITRIALHFDERSFYAGHMRAGIDAARQAGQPEGERNG